MLALAAEETLYRFVRVANQIFNALLSCGVVKATKRLTANYPSGRTKGECLAYMQQCTDHLIRCLTNYAFLNLVILLLFVCKTHTYGRKNLLPRVKISSPIIVDDWFALHTYRVFTSRYIKLLTNINFNLETHMVLRMTYLSISYVITPFSSLLS